MMLPHPDQLHSVGAIAKKVGYAGDILLTLNEGLYEVFEKNSVAFLQIPFFLELTPQQFIPFFLEHSPAFLDGICRVKFQDIDSEMDAVPLIGAFVFLDEDVLSRFDIYNLIELPPLSVIKALN